MDIVIAITPQILEGLNITLLMFILTLVISIPLGVIVSLGRLSKIKIISKITEGYVLIMRGTPLLLQIVFIYFGLPSIGVAVERFPAALTAFVLNYAAYFGEIFRGGIMSIDKGQYEASKVLGLSSKDTFFRIILPQAVKNILPPVANEIINLVKDTSLVYVVGLDELLKVGKAASNKYSSLLPLLVVGIVYLILIGVFTKALNKIEKKYNYYN